MQGYEHRDNSFFRLAQCTCCGIPTYHKPVDYRRKSGLSETYWKCENCGSESDILRPVENELEMFSKYIKRRYFDRDGS